jgi:hypothetical protein
MAAIPAGGGGRQGTATFSDIANGIAWSAASGWETPSPKKR